MEELSDWTVAVLNKNVNTVHSITSTVCCWFLMNVSESHFTVRDWSAQSRDVDAVGVCGSCTLTVLVGCGLSSVLSVYPQFLFFSPLTPVISLTVASLQGVAQDFMLSHTHCLTLSLFSVLCLAEVSCSLHSSAASTTSSCLSVVVLHRCCFSFFGVILCVHLLFVDLLSFWLSDTPSPLPAVRSPMVQCCACFQFCGWSVGLSPVHVKLCQLVLCRGLSPEWTMCIKLSSFLVWLIPTSTMLTVILSSCCGERTSVWGVFRDYPEETLSDAMALILDAIKTHYDTEKQTLRLHLQNFEVPFSNSLWIFCLFVFYRNIKVSWEGVYLLETEPHARTYSLNIKFFL